MMAVLLVEDDDLLGRAASLALPDRGLRVTWVRDSVEATAAMQAQDFDVILLDLMLPGVSGQEFLLRLRASNSAMPVVIVTARSEVSERIQMLDLGADDYIIKPFDLDEVSARLRAVKRRASASAAAPIVHELGPLRLWPANRSVLWRGQPVALSTREFDVLQLMLIRHPRPISRRQLEDALYGTADAVEGNAVEVYIHHLRKKLARSLILTIRGQGYALNGVDGPDVELAAR